MDAPKKRLAVSTETLDAVDLGLLGLLRSNARLSNSALAASVGIAASTCLERVRSLVSRGSSAGSRWMSTRPRLAWAFRR